MKPFKRLLKVVAYACLIAWALVVIYPLALMMISSLKTTPEIFSQPFSLPVQLQWKNFVDAWSRARFSSYFLNSLKVLLIAEVLIIFFSASASYPISRYNLRINSFLHIFFLAGLMLPARLGVVKLFMLMKDLGILDTLWSLVAIYVALRIPFGIYVTSSFMKSIPGEIEDAARIDGCSEFSLWARIMVPLSRPALSIVAIFSAIAVWNDFFYPFILVYDDAVKTIPVGLTTFLGQHQVNWGLLFAGLTISTLPMLLLYAVFSKQLIRGISVGGIK